MTIMKKRKLKLREHQKPASDYCISKDLSILSMCPNGGKTETSIDVIGRFLKENPKSKVLVLAYATKELKENYLNRLDGLELSFTYSTNLSDNSQVHISLPQSKGKITQKYDMLVVDEAHEFYFAKTVQNIIKKIKPKKQLLLTGTPSEFIKRNFKDIYFFALNELPEEFMSKLSIELVAIDAYWKNQYNKEGSLFNTYEMPKNQINDALKKIIFALINRLKTQVSAEEFNKQNWKYLWKKSKLGEIFSNTKLKKTVFYCRSIQQANDVYSILISRGVEKCALSHSKNDSRKHNYIADFKIGIYDVLIVVDRAKLGFDDENIYNVIDMSGTHDPNLIYQILCRVVRGNPSMEKFYLKVTTTEPTMMDITHACTCAALMLTDRKYLEKFNGSNFDVLTVKKPKSKVKNSSSKKQNTNRSIKLPEFMYDVVNGFKHIIHDLNNPASIYKTTSLKTYKSIISDGRTYYDNDIAREIASEYIEKQSLINDYPGLASFARNAGIWDEITSHMNHSKYHNRYTIDELYEMKKTISSRSEFATKYPGSYSRICREIGVDIFFSDMPSKVIPMTIERAKEFLSTCTKLQDLNGTKEGATIAFWLNSKGLYKEMTKHLIRNKIHTFESARQDAILAGSPGEFSKNYVGARVFLKRKKLLKKIYEELGWEIRSFGKF